MISKKYLGLFAIIVLTVGSSGFTSAYALYHTDYDRWVVCMVGYGDFLGSILCGERPAKDPPDDDVILKYRKCLFKGQFGNMFCPSNPDDYQPGQLCLANDQNCVINNGTSP